MISHVRTLRQPFDHSKVRTLSVTAGWTKRGIFFPFLRFVDFEGERVWVLVVSEQQRRDPKTLNPGGCYWNDHLLGICVRFKAIGQSIPQLFTTLSQVSWSHDVIHAIVRRGAMEYVSYCSDLDFRSKKLPYKTFNAYPLHEKWLKKKSIKKYGKKRLPIVTNTFLLSSRI